MLYLIQNVKTGELWTNFNGWGEDEADIFTEDEHKTLDLPIDGEWIAKPV